MTIKNKTENIKDELKRAADSLSSANLSYENSLYNDAVSRLYYFVFHLIRALLLTKGLESKTHDGALHVFRTHFIRPGIFSASDAQFIGRLMKYRLEADYNAAYVFTQKDFGEMKHSALDFQQKILNFLKQEGYLHNE